MIAALLMCGWSGQNDVVRRSGEPEVVRFESGDPEMDAAMIQARSSFDAFVSEIPRLERNNAYFSIKVPISTGRDTEHVWLADPKVEDGRVRGKLGNNPLEGSLKLGDYVEVKQDLVSDWMAVVDGELYGGFTVLVARSRMSQEEQREFDSSVDFKVPESPRTFAPSNQRMQKDEPPPGPSRATQP